MKIETFFSYQRFFYKRETLRVQLPSPALLVQSPASGNKPKYSLAFSEKLKINHFRYIFKACIDEFFGFFDVFGCSACEDVVLKGYKLGYR